jgi:predicted Fe-Mo cluster-binding NifX family protein
MKNLIAVAVDKNGNVWKGHFGMSPFYLLFDDKGKQIEKKKNPLAEENKHHDDPKLVVNLLNDCNVFIAKRMGDKSKKNLVEKLNVTPVITENENPLDALNDYLNKKEN